MQEIEDKLKTIVKDIQSGKMDSFNELYELSKKAVFYNIYSLTKSHADSEDLLHDTYVKFLENIQKVDPSSSIMGFLMVTARNLTLDAFKKSNHQKSTNEELDYASSHDEYQVGGDILLDKIGAILKKKEFEIFTLHVMSELTFEEIAKLQRRPLGTILWSYRNSIKKIRKEMAI